MAADTNRWALATAGAVQADWVSVLQANIAMRSLANRHRASKWDVIGTRKYFKPETVTTVVVRPKFRISNSFATGRVQFDAVLMNFDAGDVLPWKTSCKGFIIEADQSETYRAKWSETDFAFFGFPTQAQDCIILIVRRAIPWSDDGGSDENPDVKLWIPRIQFCPRDPSDAAATPHSGFGTSFGHFYGNSS